MNTTINDSLLVNPKELIKALSVEELCETADAYFRSIQNPTPQMGKPFSSLLEAPEILRNMGNILSGLYLGKTMTVLEFAAGTCWFSRYLNQLQCQTISCDASLAALEIGKRLFSEYPIIGDLVSEPVFLHFDGHKIDLPSESVDRIICHDGFHHIPNQEEVIAELARVLKPGGIAGFSEPGRFHSQVPQSQYEMKNYRVLENDIILPEIFEIALKFGFTDIRVKLLNDMEISLSDYQSLIEDRLGPTLSTNILTNTRQVMIHRTLFFLHKGELVHDSRSHLGLSHSITTRSRTLSARAGEDLSIPLTISNSGVARWLNQNVQGLGVVNIGTHLYDGARNLINLDFSRHGLSAPVEPGQTFEYEITIRLDNAGEYLLAIDLVSEQICWFENMGSSPLYLQITAS